MNKLKKTTAVFLALLIAVLLPLTAFAADSTNRTSAFLEAAAKSGKLTAKVTSFAYQSGKVKNNISFTFYDDVNADKICCDFEGKGFKLIYDNGELSFVVPLLFSYFSVSGKSFSVVAPVMSAVETFQRLFKSFLEDPDLTAFRFAEGKETVDGKVLDCEYFTGSVIGVVGRFYYNDADELVRVDLEDNAGAFISFTLENAGTDFNDSAVAVPSKYFNLTFLFRFFYLLLFSSVIK